MQFLNYNLKRGEKKCKIKKSEVYRRKLCQNHIPNFLWGFYLYFCIQI